MKNIIDYIFEGKSLKELAFFLYKSLINTPLSKLDFKTQEDLYVLDYDYDKFSSHESEEFNQTDNEGIYKLIRYTEKDYNIEKDSRIISITSKNDSGLIIIKLDYKKESDVNHDNPEKSWKNGIIKTISIDKYLFNEIIKIEK